MISLHFLAGMRTSNVSIVVDNAKIPMIGKETELSRRSQRKVSRVTMVKPLTCRRGSSGDLAFTCTSTPMSRTASTETTPKSSSSKRATLSSHRVLASCSSSSSCNMLPRLLRSQSHRRRRTSSTSFVDVTLSPRKTKVAEEATHKQPRKSSMSKDYTDSFRVWSDCEEKQLGTKDDENVVETSTIGRDNHNHPGSPLRVRKQRVPHHRQSSTLRHRQLMEEFMTDSDSSGITTPTGTPIHMDRKTSKRPTPPRRRERLHRREAPNSC